MANMKIELNMKGQNENFDMKGLLMKKKTQTLRVKSVL